jgi:hypothetical protein
MGDRYIQNVYDHGIKVQSLDKKLFKIFRQQSMDHFTGRQRDTGYTRLTEDEYNLLLKESAVFKHFIELKKLIVHDELPADAQTPHEALVSARKDAARLRVELDKVQAGKETLQGQMDELDVKYKELLAASGGKELVKTESALKDAQAKVLALTGENKKMQKDFDGLKAAYEALNDDLVKAQKDRK